MTRVYSLWIRQKRKVSKNLELPSSETRKHNGNWGFHQYRYTNVICAPREKQCQNLVLHHSMGQLFKWDSKSNANITTTMTHESQTHSAFFLFKYLKRGNQIVTSSKSQEWVAVEYGNMWLVPNKRRLKTRRV